ncbi:MAG: hypothetical protein WBM44_05420 [Waterburya sp.]
MNKIGTSLIYFILVTGVTIFSWLIVIGNKSPVGASSTIKPEELKSFSTVAAVGFTGVSAFMSTILSIQNISEQARISQELEKVKKLLDKGISAYTDLYASAINYYRILELLSTGNFNATDIESAETRMKEVEALLLFVSGEYSSEWQQFWQHARYMKETVHKHIPDSEARIEFWGREESVKKLAKYIEKLELLAQKQFS